MKKQRKFRSIDKARLLMANKDEAALTEVNLFKSEKGKGKRGK
jgi:hypothetical protein